MAYTRSRRETRARSHSEMEEPDSGSDYSPGSLMIDIRTDEVASSSLPSSPPSVTQPSPVTTTTSPANKGRRSSARRQYNTESNRMVFNGVTLLGQMSVIQSGHPQPLDRLDLYAYGWGDFFLDIIARRSDSLIPVKNIYEKVIPGLKRNVLSARISKLQVKSEALSEPYISAMKKLGLVVTGASHFVGIVDFIKICKYFHVQPPDSLTKFYAINSDVNPEDVLRTFSAEQTEIQVQNLQTGLGGVQASSGGGRVGMGGGGVGGGGVVLLSPLGPGDGARPNSRGSGCSVDLPPSPHTTEQVDIRRVALSGGQSAAVVVRAGEPFLLKVELPSILPSHSRDVLETIRRTYSITVEHASKTEIGVLKSMGVVGGKAGRCALFRATDVCRMFQHWKSLAPLPLRELAGGKLPDEKMDSSAPPVPPAPLPPSTIPPSSHPLPPYSLPSYSFPTDNPLPSFPTIDATPALPHSSTSHTFTASHPPIIPPLPPNPLDLPTFTSPHHPPTDPRHQTPNPHPFTVPPLSHPPTLTSTNFSISSLNPDQFQQPIQMLNSFQSSSISTLPPPPLPPPHFSAPSHPLFSTSSHHLIYSSAPPPSRAAKSNLPHSDMGKPLGIGGGNYLPTGAVHAQPQSQTSFPHGDMGKSPVISGGDYMFGSGVKMEPGSGGRRRHSSSSGPPVDDQDLEYGSMGWGEEVVSLLCPPGGAEPYIAIPELVNKIFHNRSYVSAQRRGNLGLTTVPATSLQMHALRAKGSLDAFTGNTKLVSLSGAVKLAAVSNIQIPGTVIQMIKKYCSEPLESIITPAGFAPATRPPLSHPSRLSQPSQPSQQSYFSPSHPSHSHSPSPITDSPSRSTEGGKTVPQPMKKETTSSSSLLKQEVRSSNDESAASVFPAEGVPEHPDLIDPGPYYTNTGDGTYCLVKWGGEKLALLIGSQKVHYMGLYQVFQVLFKQYVTRMNFKMRMRKLEIKSIRAASSVRQALINLDALPQSSPVCGLVRVSEVERLARSYGVEPPQVLYDVFLLRHSDQKQLPNYSRSGGNGASGKSGSPRRPQPHKAAQDRSKPGRSSPRVAASENSLQATPVPQMYQEAWETQSLLHQASQVIPSGLSFGGVLAESSRGAGASGSHGGGEGVTQSSVTSSLHQPTSSQMHSTVSTVFTTATSDKDALFVSVPRQLLTSRFRLVPRPVAPPGVMTGFHSSSRSTYPPPMSRGSALHSLAKKISQKSRKLGKGHTSGVGAAQRCPKCQYINASSKKRCQRCEEFLVGHTCPQCGSLNHTRECFKCSAVIASGGSADGHQQAVEAMTFTTLHSPPNEGDGSMSPLSPRFSPPPIRNAALKSMFPQDVGKGEDSGVVTKTMFSGNLASSRKCVECGQLNSKMAKKCLQCRSPLQGRPCPQCNRPNHSHSTECYKCGHALPCTATKWVYVGSNSNKIYRAQESITSSRISTGLKNRAATVCLRCDRLRSSGQFTCGRCGDMYWTRPVVAVPGHDTDNAQTTHHSKKRKTPHEPNWNLPTEPDSDELLSFASNLLCLGVGEGLLSVVSEAETQARETVHLAEEELEALEEEYQACAHRREEKENVLNDAQAELAALVAEVERHTHKLSQLDRREEEAKLVPLTHPDMISQLREKRDSAQSLFTLTTTTTTDPEAESMDTSQLSQ